MDRILWSTKLVSIFKELKFSIPNSTIEHEKNLGIIVGTQVLATMWASESNILVGMHDSSYSIWYCPGEASSDPTVIALTKVTSDITWENLIEINWNSWNLISWFKFCFSVIWARILFWKILRVQLWLSKAPACCIPFKSICCAKHCINWSMRICGQRHWPCAAECRYCFVINHLHLETIRCVGIDSHRYMDRIKFFGRR